MVAIATPSAPLFPLVGVDARPVDAGHLVNTPSSVQARVAGAVAMRPGLETLLWAVAAVGVFIALSFLAVRPAAGVSAPAFDQHVLVEGETLWSLASSRVPAGEAGDYVRAIVALNGPITPGSVVLLPAL